MDIISVGLPYNLPDAETGWSPERSIKLGETSLVAMLAVVDDLR